MEGSKISTRVTIYIPSQVQKITQHAEGEQIRERAKKSRKNFAGFFQGSVIVPWDFQHAAVSHEANFPLARVTEITSGRRKERRGAVKLFIVPECERCLLRDRPLRGGSAFGSRGSPSRGAFSAQCTA